MPESAGDGKKVIKCMKRRLKGDVSEENSIAKKRRSAGTNTDESCNEETTSKSIAIQDNCDASSTSRPQKVLTARLKRINRKKSRKYKKSRESKNTKNSDKKVTAKEEGCTQEGKELVNIVNGPAQSYNYNSLYVAIDCEFVGIEPNDRNALGRCSVVDYYGNILCDIYVKPNMPVRSYRTRWSGIHKFHIDNGITLSKAQQIVTKLLKNRVVVGHVVKNDFDVLPNIQHPREHTVDTAFYKPVREVAGLGVDCKYPVGLKRISQSILGRSIQKREHSSVEDSRATMDVFKTVQAHWERSHAKLLQDLLNKKLISRR